MSSVAKKTGTNIEVVVSEALDAIDAGRQLPSNRPIILKPNLTNADPPPVTTNVEVVRAVANYCRKYTSVDIMIGEGCGSGRTADGFDANGYSGLADDLGLSLVDFNTLPYVRVTRDDTLVWREFFLPEVALDAFIVSIPVLKDHSFTRTTISMKNMFGLAPEAEYGGSWNKSALHTPSTHKSTVDICLYKKPELCVVDATVALTGMHLAGTPKRFDTILAGFDPVAVDAEGSRMLGHDPSFIEYLQLAEAKGLGRISEYN